MPSGFLLAKDESLYTMSDIILRFGVLWATIILESFQLLLNGGSLWLMFNQS